jgi:CheY-like chemotaxis protein
MNIPNPDVQLLIMTGYVESDERLELLNAGVKHLILKPFTHDDLLRAIQEIFHPKRSRTWADPVHAMQCSSAE